MLVWGGGGVSMAAVPPAHCAPSVDRVRDMSLFHDFKLKRRKVDSRGSSDGEFIIYRVKTVKVSDYDIRKN